MECGDGDMGSIWLSPTKVLPADKTSSPVPVGHTRGQRGAENPVKVMPYNLDGEGCRQIGFSI